MQAVIRVNSQSGKGMWPIMDRDSADLPTPAQISSQVIQHPDRLRGGVLETIPVGVLLMPSQSHDAPWSASPWSRCRIPRLTARQQCVVMNDAGNEVAISGVGNGPVAAFCEALSSHGVNVRVLDYADTAAQCQRDARAAAYLECAVAGRVLWVWRRS